MSHQLKKKLGSVLHHNGVEFRVWAPFAANVKVLTPFLGVFDGSNVYDMLNEGDGYWSVFVKDAQAGQNYKYQIDTGNELIQKNDPRARSVTASDNGVSVVVANDFDWGDDLFMPIPREKQIIYELHIGTFNRRDPATQGTFYEAIDKLDYLRSIGINVVELMPVTSMTNSNGWGYNTSDIFSIENAYGGRHGLMEFVKACHARGIGVIVDVVYNHFMSSDLWRYDGWYENDRGGIYFYNDARGDTPWGARPDYGRAEVRQFLLDNVVMWFNEYRIDGLRLDSTCYMRNTAGVDDYTHDIGDAWSLLQDIATTAHKVRPGAIVAAEDTGSNEYITKPREQNGCGLDAQWSQSFPHAVRRALGLSVPYQADLREQLFLTYNGDPFQRIVFSDSHDTAANGAVRLNEAITPGNSSSMLARQRLLIASTLALTAPGIPMLLQGQEFMQKGAFNDWKALEWNKVEHFAGMVEAHKHLIALRLNQYGNSAGLMGKSIAVVHQNDADYIMGYHRWDQGGAGDDVIVLINFGKSHFKDYSIHLPRNGQWRVRFDSTWSGYSSDFTGGGSQTIDTDDNGMGSLAVAPYGAYIISQDPIA